MKLSFAILVTALTAAVSAGGQRGAMERVMFWFAYLADEEVGGSRIAPGCGAKMAGGNRCNLDQFLQYLWKANPKKPWGWEPTVNIALPTKNNGPNGYTITELFSKIYSFRETKQVQVTDPKNPTAPPKTVTKEMDVFSDTDAAKLYPGSADWYDAVAKSTEPLKDLQARIDDGTATDKQREIVAKGKAAAEACVELRWADAEKFRVPMLKEKAPKVGGKSGIMWDNIALTASQEDGKQVVRYARFSLSKTETWYKNQGYDLDTLRAELKALNQAHWAKDVNADHLRAIQSVEAAAVVLSCPNIGSHHVGTRIKRMLGLDSVLLADRLRGGRVMF